MYTEKYITQGLPKTVFPLKKASMELSVHHQKDKGLPNFPCLGNVGQLTGNGWYTYPFLAATNTFVIGSRTWQKKNVLS